MPASQKIEITHLFESIPHAHVLYYSQEADAYVNHAVAYILTGIRLGKRTLIIENDRFRRLIETKLHSVLSAAQMQEVLFQNNFEFFSLILNPEDPSQHRYFNERHKKYIDHYAQRIWSHIEWSRQAYLRHHIEEFERKADALLKEAHIPCVCIYNQGDLTDQQQKALLCLHDFKLTDQSELIDLSAKL